MITQDIESRINAATNDEDAQEILFAHLLRHADVDSLLKYCEVIIAANGYPRMQSLGMKMKEDLQCMQGGWLCVSVCEGACVFVSVYVHMWMCTVHVCVLMCALFCNKLSECSLYMRTYIHNMVYVLCIVCTVCACGHTCVCVCICVLLFVHISAGETWLGQSLQECSY